MGATHLGQRQARFLLQKSGVEEPGPSSLRVRPAWPQTRRLRPTTLLKETAFSPHSSFCGEASRPPPACHPKPLCPSQLSSAPLSRPELGGTHRYQPVSRELVLLTPLMIP